MEREMPGVTAGGASEVEGPSPGTGPILTLTEKAARWSRLRWSAKARAASACGLGSSAAAARGFSTTWPSRRQPGTDDTVFEQGGVTIFVDEASQPHLLGMTLDYVTGLHGAGFKFLNPNATRTCGCGSSFAT